MYILPRYTNWKNLGISLESWHLHAFPHYVSDMTSFHSLETKAANNISRKYGMLILWLPHWLISIDQFWKLTDGSEWCEWFLYIDSSLFFVQWNHYHFINYKPFFFLAFLFNNYFHFLLFSGKITRNHKIHYEVSHSKVIFPTPT